MMYIRIILLQLIMLICIPRAQAEEWHLLQADYAGIEYREHQNYRDDYFPQYTTIDGKCAGTNLDGSASTECFQYGANVLFDINLITIPGVTRIFWKNDVGMDATNKQVRHVGWDWQLGLPITDKLEFYHHHYSQHILDSDGQVPGSSFPLRDEYILRINLYRREK